MNSTPSLSEEKLGQATEAMKELGEMAITTKELIDGGMRRMIAQEEKEKRRKKVEFALTQRRKGLTIKNAAQPIRRNEKCPCGSGKKFKKCGCPLNKVKVVCFDGRQGIFMERTFPERGKDKAGVMYQPIVPPEVNNAKSLAKLSNDLGNMSGDGHNADLPDNDGSDSDIRGQTNLDLTIDNDPSENA
jgi:hypothetical protein